MIVTKEQIDDVVRDLRERYISAYNYKDIAICIDQDFDKDKSVFALFDFSSKTYKVEIHDLEQTAMIEIRSGRFTTSTFIWAIKFIETLNEE